MGPLLMLNWPYPPLPLPLPLPLPIWSTNAAPEEYDGSADLGLSMGSMMFENPVFITGGESILLGAGLYTTSSWTRSLPSSLPPLFKIESKVIGTGLPLWFMFEIGMIGETGLNRCGREVFAERGGENVMLPFESSFGIAEEILRWMKSTTSWSRTESMNNPMAAFCSSTLSPCTQLLNTFKSLVKFSNSSSVSGWNAGTSFSVPYPAGGDMAAMFRLAKLSSDTGDATDAKSGDSIESIGRLLFELPGAFGSNAYRDEGGERIAMEVSVMVGENTWF